MAYVFFPDTIHTISRQKKKDTIHTIHVLIFFLYMLWFVLGTFYTSIYM